MYTSNNATETTTSGGGGHQVPEVVNDLAMVETKANETQSDQVGTNNEEPLLITGTNGCAVKPLTVTTNEEDEDDERVSETAALTMC